MGSGLAGVRANERPPRVSSLARYNKTEYPMSWADVVAAINFWAPGDPTTVNGINSSAYGTTEGFSPDVQDDILGALQSLYDNSSTARELLDAGAESGQIWLFNLTDVTDQNKNPVGSFSLPGTFTSGLNLNQPSLLQWMGRNGQLQQETLGGMVIHELIHAIRGTDDLVDPTTGIPIGINDKADYNNPKFDFLGQTVRIQNQIFQEMGWGSGYWQVGYDATNFQAPNLNPNISYTEGNNIDIAYFSWSGAKTPNDLDLSSRTDNSNDLIIGSSGNDTIRGGTGNDYLYGGN